MTIKPLVSLLHIALSQEKVLSLYQEINDHVRSSGVSSRASDHLHDGIVYLPVRLTIHTIALCIHLYV